MKRLALIVACVVALVGTVAVVSGLSSCGIRAQAALIPSDQLVTMLGGACANVKCMTKTCYETTPPSCQGTQFAVCTRSGDKCVKRLPSQYARCDYPATGFTCSETSSTGCYQDYTGDPDAYGKCPETQCTTQGMNCGETKYTCKDETCGT